VSTIRTRTLEDVPPRAPAPAETREVTALVDRAKEGDALAFEGLMRLYERRIILLGTQMGLSREDSLDACQETFVKVFRYIGRFRTGESFFKWLYRIAIHVIYDQLRRSRATAMVSIEEIGPEVSAGLGDPPPGLHRRVEAADLASKILGGMASLTRRERVVFALRDLHEMSTEEIGRIHRLSQITVRRHCASARQKLRERLFAPGSERSGGPEGTSR
jgi:RNA polymerase sigma-70 factor (ECF subfamily)